MTRRMSPYHLVTSALAALVLLLAGFTASATAQAPAPTSPQPSTPSKPFNDSFASAQTVGTSTGYLSLSGTPTGATAETGEPSHGAVAAHHSVWFQWKPQITERVSFSSCASVPISVAFYTGTAVNALTRVGGGAFDASCGSASVWVTAGTTYRIAVDGAGASVPAAFNVSFDRVHRTTNDTRETAWTIPFGEETTISASNAGMTTSAGEPNHADQVGGHSVWFDLAVQEGVPVTLDLCDSEIDTLLAVYTRSYGGYTEVASNDNEPSICGAGKTGGFLRFTPVADGAVHIAVDGKAGATGRYTLLARANDTKAGAIPVYTSNEYDTYSTRGARTDAGETGNATWYATSVSEGQLVEIDTCSSIPGPVDTIVTAFAAETGAQLATNDDTSGCAGGGSRLSFRAASTGRILIAVAGKNGATGTFRLRTTLRPVNDDFADALELNSNAAGIFVPSGTRQTGEPDHGVPAAPSTLWWKMTGVTGQQTLRVCRFFGTEESVGLGVYTGTAVGALTKIVGTVVSGSPVFNGGVTSCMAVTFNASASTTYSIALASAGRTAAYVQRVPPPSNDAFANPATLTLYGSTSGDTAGATAESGEPVHAGTSARHSVWYRLTVPANQSRRVALSLCSYSGAKIRAAAYTGTSVGSLTPVTATTTPVSSSCSSGGVLQWRAPDSASTLTYYVAVDSPDDAMGSFSTSFTTGSGPSNDDRADATELYGVPSMYSSYLSGATRESGEPDHAGAGKTGSVWYRWKATASERVQFDTCATAYGTNASTALAVYTSGYAGLNEVGSAASSPGCGSGARVAFNAVSGTTYLIAVASSDSGSFTLRSVKAPSPDTWANAYGLYDGTTQSLDLATADSLDSTWLGAATTQTVWFSFQPTSSGRVTVDLCDDAYGFTAADTLLAVIENPDAGSGARVVGRNDDDPGCGPDGRRSRVTFDAVVGKTYGVLIGGKGTTYGDVMLGVTPPNDDFASAAKFSGTYFSASGNLRRATAEAGEPRHGGADAAHSTWYDWTPDQSGIVILDACSYGGTRLGVYTGSTLAALTPVSQEATRPCPNSGTGPQARFAVTAGTSYKIAVDRTDGGYAYVYGRWVPENDALAKATQLTSGTSFSSSLGDATLETGEPDHGGAATSVWYRYTPTSDGTGNVDTCSTSGSVGATVDVYTQAGTGMSGLKKVTGAKASGCGGGAQAAAKWRAVGGTTYYIAVGAPASFSGNASIWIGSGPSNDDLASTRDISQYGSSWTTAGAGTETGEAGVAGGAGRTVWGQTQLSAGTSATFRACRSGSGEVPRIALYSSSASTPTHATLSPAGSAAYVEDGCAKVDVVRGGGTYYVAIDSAAAEPFGNSFTVSYALAPSNDAQASPQMFSDSARGTLVAGTSEPSEPTRAGHAAKRSVWYSWTAPAAGPATFEVCSEGFSPVLAAYSVSEAGVLTQQAATASARACPGGLATSVTFTAAAAKSYRLAVDLAAGSPGSFELSAPPANDYFAAATTTYDGYGLSGRLLAATAEAGEPAHAASAATRSVWFAWTPSRTAKASITTCLQSSAKTRIAVYTGDTVGSLTSVGSAVPSAGCASGNGASLRLSVVSGTTYRIAVDGDAGARFNLLTALAPTNDFRADAETVTRGELVYGTNLYATAEASEPAHNGNPASASVWFKYVADRSGTMSVKACSSSFSAAIGVYLANGTAVSTSADGSRRCSGASTASTADVKFTATAGTTYLVALDGVSGATGSFQVAFGGPDGDDLDDAITIPAAGGSFIADTSAATTEASEPTSTYPYGRHSVWWKWTAPSSKTVEMNSCGSGNEQKVDVFTRAGSTLTPVSGTTPTGCYGSRVSFAATSGTTYYVRLSGYYGTTAARLQVLPPSNDWFATAQAVGAAPITVDGTLVGAAAEDFEYPSTARTLWYSWVASGDGRATFDTCLSDAKATVAVYTGSASYNLFRRYGEGTQQSCADRGSVTIPVVSGTTYYVQVLGAESEASPATKLRVTFAGDTTPPETSISPGPTSPVKTPPTFVLGSSENPSTFECRLDGGAWTACGTDKRYTPVTSKEGAHTVEAVAIDNVGNRDATPASATFTLDLTAPTVQIDAAPSGTLTTSQATFRFSSPESGATFVCSVGGRTESCTSPYTRTDLPDGALIFSVRAVDAPGNPSAPSTKSFVVDTGAPETTIAPVPAVTNASTISIRFSSEPGATFKCALDNATLAACTSPVTLTPAEGVRRFRVVAADVAGNVEPSAAEVTFTVDRTAPQTSIGTLPADRIHDVLKVPFSSSEPTGATFRCSIDGRAYAECTPNASIALVNVKPGPHTLSVFAKDAAGNEDATPAQIGFTVANAAPKPVLTVSPNAGVAELTVAATVAATDSDATDVLDYELSFGDGTAAVTGLLPTTGSTSHVYKKAGTYVAALTVDDGFERVTTTVTVRVALAEQLSAAAGDDRVVTAGDSVELDGSASRPAAGVDKYRWDFGDGSNGEGSRVTHTYAEAGTYTARLTVSGSGGTSTDDVRIDVRPATEPVTVVTVMSGGSTLAGADVMIVLPDGERISGVTGGDGRARLSGLPTGSYRALAYKPGYRPSSSAVDVTDGRGTATIALTAGDMAKATVDWRRLSYAEILALGIDPADPANQHVIEFAAGIEIGPESNDCTLHANADRLWASANCGGGGSSGGGGGGGGAVCERFHCRIPAGKGYADFTFHDDPDAPTLTTLVIPFRATWLKEFFEVGMTVTNLADPEFVLDEGSATLELPDGLSLAPTARGEELVHDMPAIPGGQESRTTWIVRGDKEGDYDLSATYAGVVQPFGRGVSFTGTTSTPLKVWGGNALKFIVDVDKQAGDRYPYLVKVGVQNVSDAPVYNPSVELLKEGRRGYIEQPLQQREYATPEISAGSTFWAGPFIVVPEKSGEVDLSKSFVRKTAGDAAFNGELRLHDRVPSIEDTPIIEGTRRSSGKVILEWPKAAGATTERLFSTPDRETDFPDTPLDATPSAGAGGKQTVTLTGVKSSQWLGLSSTIGGVPTLAHPILDTASLPLTGTRVNLPDLECRKTEVKFSYSDRWVPITGWSYRVGQGAWSPVTTVSPAKADGEGSFKLPSGNSALTYSVRLINGDDNVEVSADRESCPSEWPKVEIDTSGMNCELGEGKVVVRSKTDPDRANAPKVTAISVIAGTRSEQTFNGSSYTFEYGRTKSYSLRTGGEVIRAEARDADGTVGEVGVQGVCPTFVFKDDPIQTPNSEQSTPPERNGEDPKAKGTEDSPKPVQKNASQCNAPDGMESDNAAFSAAVSAGTLKTGATAQCVFKWGNAWVLTDGVIRVGGLSFAPQQQSNTAGKGFTGFKGLSHAIIIRPKPAANEPWLQTLGRYEIRAGDVSFRLGVVDGFEIGGRKPRAVLNDLAGSEFKGLKPNSKSLSITLDFLPGGAKIEAHFKADQLGTKFKDTDIKLVASTTNESGLQLGSVQLTASGQIGPAFQFAGDLSLRTRPGGWSFQGQLKAKLGKKPATVDAELSFSIANGQVERVSASVVKTLNPPKPLGTPWVMLNKVGLDLGYEGQGANKSLSIGGRAGVNAAGLKFGSWGEFAVFSGEMGLLYSLNENSADAFRLEGTANLFVGKINGVGVDGGWMTGQAVARTSGYFDMQGKFDFKPNFLRGSILDGAYGASGEMFAWFDGAAKGSPRFSMEGKGKVQIPLREADGSMKLTSKGAGLCVTGKVGIGDFSVSGTVGALVRWEDKKLDATCDFGPLKTVPSGRELFGSKKAVRLQDAGPMTTTIGAGSPSVSYLFTGRDRMPEVRITGPGGFSLSTAVADSADPRMVTFRNPVSNQVMVILMAPAAGDYTFTPDAPVATVGRSLALAPPKVKVSAKHKPGKRVELEYRVRGREGRAIQLVERTGAGTAVLGSVDRDEGTLRFKAPEGAAGKRDIYMSYSDGTPLVKVGSYRYSGPTRAAKPGKVRLKFTAGAGLTVRFGKARSAESGYRISVNVAGEKTVRFVSPGEARSLTLPWVGAGRKVSVRVVALDAARRPSPPSKAKLTTGAAAPKKRR